MDNKIFYLWEEKKTDGKWYCLPIFLTKGLERAHSTQSEFKMKIFLDGMLRTTTSDFKNMTLSDNGVLKPIRRIQFKNSQSFWWNLDPIEGFYDQYLDFNRKEITHYIEYSFQNTIEVSNHHFQDTFKVTNIDFDRKEVTINNRRYTMERTYVEDTQNIEQASLNQKLKSPNTSSTCISGITRIDNAYHLNTLRQYIQEENWEQIVKFCQDNTNLSLPPDLLKNISEILVNKEARIKEITEDNQKIIHVFKSDSSQKEDMIQKLREENKSIELKLKEIETEMNNLRESLTLKSNEVAEKEEKINLLGEKTRKLESDLNSKIVEIREKDNKIRGLASNGNSSLVVFPMSDLSKATNEFKEENKIGSGGCADVFKGKLWHTKESFTLVAIKKLSSDLEIQKDFLKAEITFLTKYRHPHLITLLGHSSLDVTQPCLVYQLASQGSLRHRLDCKDNTPILSWDVRLKIAYQSANALSYLHKAHSEAESLVHADIKSDNILLDENNDAKVSDFGLVKSIGGSRNMAQTQNLTGTIGYMCPHFLETGEYSDKTDVFAFGVVIGELITGKMASFSEGINTINLSRRIRQDWNDQNVSNYLDPKLNGNWPKEILIEFSKIAKSCVAVSPKDRPSMDQVFGKINNLMKYKNRSCVVCMDNPTNARLQCGHACLCSTCATSLRNRGLGCPLCRAQISSLSEGLYTNTYIP